MFFWDVDQVVNKGRCADEVAVHSEFRGEPHGPVVHPEHMLMIVCQVTGLGVFEHRCPQVDVPWVCCSDVGGHSHRYPVEHVDVFVVVLWFRQDPVS